MNGASMIDLSLERCSNDREQCLYPIITLRLKAHPLDVSVRVTHQQARTLHKQLGDMLRQIREDRETKENDDHDTNYMVRHRIEEAQRVS